MAIKKIKISELPLVASVIGLYTIGIDALNRSVKISLEFIKEITDAANEAATAANDAADAANDATSAANEATANATNAATTANEAADAANAAADAANDAATAANDAADAATAANDAADAANGATADVNEAIANAATAAAAADAAAADAAAAADEARGPIQFTEANSKGNIASGDATSTIFGKLAKWFSSFGALAWKSKVDYASEVENKPTFKTIFSQAITGTGNINPKLIEDIAYNGSTGDITISFSDSSADKVINIPVDNFLASAAYDAETHILTLTLQNEEEVEVDLGDLIHEYEAAEDGGLEIINGNQFRIKDGVMSEITKTPIQKEVTLLIENWTGEGDLWSYEVQDEDVADGCLFEAWPADRDSKQIALYAEVDENIIVDDNIFTITCVKKPHSDFSIIYTMLL
jgi:uncharacterized phage infection (PIP) family protein YhgE